MPKVDMLGQRFYCILKNDELCLFESEEHASLYIDNPGDEMTGQVQPTQQFTIFRFSRHGIL